MDSRHTPYSRASDRALIQNPNHQTHSQSQPPPPPPPSQHHAYHAHAAPPPPPPSSSAQPSYQMPSMDPFQRRAPDPFFPTHGQARRRGSYGMGSSRDVPAPHEQRPSLGAPWTGSTGNNSSSSSSSVHHHHHSGPPPPPALSAAAQGPPQAAYAHEPALRRASIGGQSPPRYYAQAPSNEPPPPSSGFMTRQMPPPSPSQQPPPGLAYSRAPPPPPPFAGSRELPGLGSMSRPGTGMSISSILGDNAASQAPTYAYRTSPTATSRSPIAGTKRPLSPHRRGHSVTSKPTDNFWRRPQTPEKHHGATNPRPGETSFSAGSSPAHFANARRSPEFARGIPLYNHPYQVLNARAYHPPPNDGQERDVHLHGDERNPPRPISQPAAAAFAPTPAPAPEHPSRKSIPPFGSRPPFQPYHTHEQREEQRPHMSTAYDPGHFHRDRAITDEPIGQAYSPPASHRDALGQQRPKEELAREQPRREEYPGPFRTGFRNQYYQPLGAAAVPEAPRSHPQAINPFDRPHESQQPYPLTSAGPPPTDARAREERRPSDPQTLVESTPYRGLVQEQQQPLLMQRSRSSIGLEGKRGRASPLPQAVQGAAMQPMGAGTDPHIKNEFGRIFQGLGMGGHGHGSLTPSRQSPMPQRIAPEDPIVLSEGEVPRSGSVRAAKKHGRVKEEGLEMDPIEGRGTPSGGKAAKKAKVGVSHHHHLHQHAHPHHHHIHGHVHRPDEDIGRASTGTPSAQAHHHHHIHTSHHHHHTPIAPRAPLQAPIVPISRPILTVSSQIAIDSVKDRTRRHLGSELYEPKFELPPSAMPSHSDDKFGYFLKYVPSRTYEEKDLNCTMTIRIPKEYLAREARENICKNRNLFGTGVYTDDSDPLAVLVHEGWIRGEFPEDADLSQAEIGPGDARDFKDGEEITTKPTTPIVPPEDMDLQVTMLILPLLKTYKGVVRYGLRSGDWPEIESTSDQHEPHDGLSWTVLKIRWVDEEGSRGVPRGGKARRQRLMVERQEAAQALLGMAGLGAGRGHGLCLERARAGVAVA